MKQPIIVHASEAPEYYLDERCYITEWWNDGADEDCSIARARVEPGVTTRLHRLNGVAERYVVLQGTGRVEAGTRDAETVAPGSVVVIPPDTAQRITNNGDEDLVFLAICTPRFRPGVYEDIDAE